ncbi:MAG TPA: LuxR C-terminal-related transcriptional regulator [Candidatus Saccharimonadales bacterium]|nr:LuxR C-terminal-related transcriptional regulator [Candidatus Saccharimonadales bacterium]
MQGQLKAIEDLSELSECEDTSAFEKESVRRLSALYGSPAVFVEYSPLSMRVVSTPSHIEGLIGVHFPSVQELMAREEFVKHFYKRPERFHLPVTHADLQSNRKFWNSKLYSDFYRHLERARFAANFALAQNEEVVTGYVILRSTTVQRSITGFSDFERQWQPVVRGRLAQAFASLTRKQRTIPERDELILERINRSSAREKQVVSLIANAKSDEDIAAALGISVKTVASHKTRILDHIFCEERHELDKSGLSSQEHWKQKLRLASDEGKELRAVLNRHLSKLKLILGHDADYIR